VNIDEAKRILIACRPGSDDLRTPEADTALALARENGELRQWWHEQQNFQKQVRAQFGEIPVPDHLRDGILARAKTVKLPLWRQTWAWSAAAAIVLLLATIAIWQRPSAEDSFETFRSRMVRKVLREYRMDITTSDMARVRQFLEVNNAPADYMLPPNAARLPVMGAGVLSWHERRVSMVCLNGGAQGTVFVFVVDSSAVKNAPRIRELAQVSELPTVSWSEGGKTYLMAGAGAVGQ
jgi:hypothetical protein